MRPFLILSAAAVSFVAIPIVHAPPCTDHGPARTFKEAMVPTSHAEPPAPAAPDRLRIPRIALDTAVEHVGLVGPDRKLDIPRNWNNAGWFEDGPRPGEHGAAIVDGVLDTIAGPAVFYRLQELVPGDDIVVLDEEGQERTFVVRETRVFDVRTAPLQTIYTGTGRNLHLITCAGKWDKSLDHYDQRFVVFADLRGN